jgi:putative hydrolase of the HAD superfamily
MITTVIFDLDDTLYDEIDYCRSGFAAVAESVANLSDAAAAEHIFNIFWKQFVCGNRTKTFDAGLDELAIQYDDELIDKLIETYRNHMPRITLPPDSEDVLSKLSGKYTLALLTDGFLPAQRLKVQALGIEKFFEHIVYTEELGRDCWKPSPVGFEQLIKVLDTDAKSMAYVADNEEKDFITPNKLGFCTIQIIRPARIHVESSTAAGAAARYIIDTISQLPAVLTRL